MPPEAVRGCLLLRSTGGGPFEQLGDTLRSDDDAYVFVDDAVEPGILYDYRIMAFFGSSAETIAIGGGLSIEDYPFIADQNYPNPFSNSTTIGFFVPEAMKVRVDIYDIAGRLVESLGESMYERGTALVEWTPSAERAASGVYFCVFRYRGRMKSVKMVILR